MRLFRFAEDRLPVAVMSLLFAFDLAVYSLVDSPLWLFSWTLVGILPKAHVCSWNHHHQHVSVFLSPLANRALELMYALQTGISSHAWVLHHSIGHHRNYLDQAKDESRWQRADGSVMSEFEYTLEVGLTAYPRAWAAGRQFPRQRRIFLWMGILTLVVALTLVVVRPLAALAVFILPMVISLFLTAWATHSHHSGKSTDSHFVACNNILHRGYNIVTGNLGYHTAHHYQPGLHWSRLPALHEEIADRIPLEAYLTPGLPWNWGQKENPLERPSSPGLLGLSPSGIAAAE